MTHLFKTVEIKEPTHNKTQRINRQLCALEFGFVRCAVWCLAERGQDPFLRSPPICPVRESHKVQSLLIVPVPDGRFRKMKARRLIRFPVLFGAKVSSFPNTFPAMPSVTLNSTPNRKLQKRLATFVNVRVSVCVEVKYQSCVWNR